MGVPKFFRWLTQRYPFLLQIVTSYQIPEFDNFYLDMNGIIHPCSHGEEVDMNNILDERKIFENIGHYVEFLFNIIKPKKIFFLAVDGVAPRAKMNQQRARRFRSAKELEEILNKAREFGQILDESNHFDSNCITPGTEFMARLHSYLQHFIHRKLSTDTLWSTVQVILSGHDVPGEGEHKIMDYIRHCRSQLDHNPNTRHCLHGLDADLIMLGIATHEPYFSLLREEIKFGAGNKKQIRKVEDQTFHLLHLSLLRQYLNFDFSEIADQLQFEYDIERIIDDWVLMGFLAGNDFVPNLPNIHIKHEGLPYLHMKYMQLLPKLSGYLTDKGELHLQRLQKYISSLAEFDIQEFQEHYINWSVIKSKRKENSAKKEAKKEAKKRDSFQRRELLKNSGEINETDFMGMTLNIGNSSSDSEMECGSTSNVEDDVNTSLTKLGISNIPEELLEEQVAIDDPVFSSIHDLGKLSLTAFNLPEECFTDQKFDLGFKDYKCTYYKKKFNFQKKVSLSFLMNLNEEYIRGLQWIMWYYYKSVPSWSWFYPFHYAPFVSDIYDITDLKLEYTLNSPFKPFEQLMAVLPARSKLLVPYCYRKLMTESESPILSFYPNDCEVDLNGKTNEWEAVVLLDFIDEFKLLSALKLFEGQLSTDEKLRNEYGTCFSFHHDRKSNIINLNPPKDIDWLANVNPCLSTSKNLGKNPFNYDRDNLHQGLLPGAKTDHYCPGFPNFRFLPYTIEKLTSSAGYISNTIVEKQRIQVNLSLEEETRTLGEIAYQMISKQFLVNWPFMIRALAEAVSDGSYIFELNSMGEIIGRDLGKREQEDWEKTTINIEHNMYSNHGINLGRARFMVHAKVMEGKRVVYGRKKEEPIIKTEIQWAKQSTTYLLQSVLPMDESILVYDPSPNVENMKLSEIFYKGRECYLMRTDVYGFPAIVDVVDENLRTIQVKMTEINMNDMFHDQAEYISNVYLDSLPEFRKFMPGYAIASKANVHKTVFTRLTSGLFIFVGNHRKSNNPKLFIHFSIKSSKRDLCLPEFAYKGDRNWLFSPKLINIFKKYKELFPEVFDVLEENPNCEDYYSCTMFDESVAEERIDQLKKFLNSQPCYEKEMLPCGSEILYSNCISMLENSLEKCNTSGVKHKRKVVKCKPKDLFCPMPEISETVPDPDATYYILDRVILLSPELPFGSMGVIIGFYPGTESSELFCEVMFEKDFPAGISIRGSSKRCLKVKSSKLINLTHGHMNNSTNDNTLSNHKECEINKGNSFELDHQTKYNIFDGNYHSGIRTDSVVHIDPKTLFSNNNSSLFSTKGDTLTSTIPYISHYHKSNDETTYFSHETDNNITIGNNDSYSNEFKYNYDMGGDISHNEMTFDPDLVKADDPCSLLPDMAIYPSAIGDPLWYEDCVEGRNLTSPSHDFRNSYAPKQVRARSRHGSRGSTSHTKQQDIPPSIPANMQSPRASLNHLFNDYGYKGFTQRSPQPLNFGNNLINNYNLPYSGNSRQIYPTNIRPSAPYNEPYRNSNLSNLAPQNFTSSANLNIQSQMANMLPHPNHDINNILLRNTRGINQQSPQFINNNIQFNLANISNRQQQNLPPHINNMQDNNFTYNHQFPQFQDRNNIGLLSPPNLHNINNQWMPQVVPYNHMNYSNMENNYMSNMPLQAFPISPPMQFTSVLTNRQKLEQYCMAKGYGFPKYDRKFVSENGKGMIGIVILNIDTREQRYQSSPQLTIDDAYEGAAGRALLELNSAPLSQREYPPTQLPSNPFASSLAMIPRSVTLNAYKKYRPVFEKSSGDTLLTGTHVAELHANNSSNNY